MKIHWTSKALQDLNRLFEFLEPLNRKAAAKAVDALAKAPRKRLALHVRIGERLERYAPKEIRRLFVEQYEIRYEIVDGEIYILRVWHTRERR